VRRERDSHPNLLVKYSLNSKFYGEKKKKCLNWIIFCVIFLNLI